MGGIVDRTFPRGRVQEFEVTTSFKAVKPPKIEHEDSQGKVLFHSVAVFNTEPRWLGDLISQLAYKFINGKQRFQEPPVYDSGPRTLTHQLGHVGGSRSSVTMPAILFLKEPRTA